VLISVNGVRLEYVTEGSGPPVVFSHGGSSDVRYWEPQRRAFSQRHRFVAYSQRFKGKGSWPADADPSAAAHVADLVAIMSGLDAGPVDLVGFSSALALRAALAAPELVRTLTIIEPNVPWLLEGDSDGQAILAAWRAANERITARAADDDTLRARLWFELVDNGGPGTFDAQPEAFRSMWIANFGPTSPAGAAAEPLTCDRFAAISMPTLILAAEHGMPYSRRITERLAGCISTSRLVVVPGVTHFMSFQTPARFNALVLDFIDRR
jgi:pimeloyl-ACP methyl ester carboxylesterase